MIPIEFDGFSADCRIRGRLTLSGDRLTDMLDEQDRYRLERVSLESLEDGHVIGVDSLVVERIDLLAVVASGPRGSDRRRVDLETVRMQVCVGPYVVAGHLHAEHGADPLASVLARRSMVPLTQATIAFTQAGEVRVVDVAAVIVNRDLAGWIVPTGDEAAHFPDVEIRPPSWGSAMRLTGPLAI